jgi:precorrin-6B methylase 2
MKFHPEQLLELARSYQPACIIAAAADLELFDRVERRARTAPELASQTGCDLRGLSILLDALASLGLLRKTKGLYGLPREAAPFLTTAGAQTVLPMIQHQANCLRNWAQLANVVKSGGPAAKIPSVRGSVGDAAAFIGAMHTISAPVANRVIRAVRPLRFAHLLDIGGASGTWTIAFLKACPSARATLFDLPHVIPMARRRFAAARLSRRTSLVAGDFMQQGLPGGVDLAWLSAIVHQNSRKQNRTLFGNIREALVSGGRLAIRDIVMESDRTQPVAGALFAINMLVATEGGGTFTFDELREDLETAGFERVALVRSDPAMNSVVIAHKAE